MFFEPVKTMQQDEELPEFNQGPQQQLQIQPLKSVKKRYRSFWRILFLITNLSLSAFYFGYTIIYINLVDFSTIINVYHIQMKASTAEGLLTFCVPLGGLIGALSSSFFIKRLSRRDTLLYANYTAFFLGILMYFVDFKLYMLVRIGQGMCAGTISSILPLIIKQLAPFELSGLFGVFQQIFITLGLFICSILSFIFSVTMNDPTGSEYWHYLFGVPLITIVIQTILLHTIYKYETPRYLLQKNKQNEARTLLDYIYFSEYVDQICKQIKNDIEDTSKQSNDSEKIINSQELSLPKKVAIHLALLQQCSGISAINSYGRQIAQSSLSSVKTLLPSILNFEQVLFAAISSFLLTKYGRKLILQFGTVGSAFANVAIALGFFLMGSAPTLSVVLIIGALLYFEASFNLSLGPIVWLYIPEIVRPTFLPYSTMVNWGASALSILLFPIIRSHLPGENPAPLFLFFAVWSAVAYFFNKKYVIETRNRTGAEIYEQYKSLQQE